MTRGERNQQPRGVPSPSPSRTRRAGIGARPRTEEPRGRGIGRGRRDSCADADVRDDDDGDDVVSGWRSRSGCRRRVPMPARRWGWTPPGACARRRRRRNPRSDDDGVGRWRPRRRGGRTARGRKARRAPRAGTRRSRRRRRRSRRTDGRSWACRSGSRRRRSRGPRRRGIARATEGARPPSSPVCVVGTREAGVVRRRKGRGRDRRCGIFEGEGTPAHLAASMFTPSFDARRERVVGIADTDPRATARGGLAVWRRRRSLRGRGTCKN